MIELDFSKIQFCGRQEELSQLQLAFDQACNVQSPTKRRRWRQRSQPQHEELKQPEQPDGDGYDQHHHNHLEDKKNTIGPIVESNEDSRPLPVVLIRGASGTGKSALVEHFLQQQKVKLKSHNHQTNNNSNYCPLLVGRGKFEEPQQQEQDGAGGGNSSISTGEPYAVMMDCWNALLDELDQQSLDMQLAWYQSFQPNEKERNGYDYDYLDVAEKELIRSDINKLCKSGLVPKLESILATAAAAAEVAASSADDDDIVHSLDENQPQHLTPNRRGSYENPDASGMLSRTTRGSYDDDFSASSCANSADNDTLRKRNAMKAGKGGKYLFNRYRLMLRSLLKSLCNMFTVILYCDDLQWADKNTVQLLNSLLLDKSVEMRNKLFIGTYRTVELNDEEQSSTCCFDPSCLLTKDKGAELQTNFSSSPKRRRRKRGRKGKQEQENQSQNDGDDTNATSSGPSFTLITLNDFDHDTVAVVVSNLLGRDFSGINSSAPSKGSDRDIMDLAKLVHHRTNGSIYFVIQYLRLLYDRKYITYNLTTLQWECSPESIDRITLETEYVMNNTVIDILCAKILNLSSRHSATLQMFLTMAAFVGFTHFDSHLIFQMIQLFQKHLKNCKMPTPATNGYRHGEVSGAAVTDATVATNEEKEEPASKKLLLIQNTDEIHEMLHIAVKEGLLERLLHRNRRYKFAHDRVREAAMSLVPRFLDVNETIETLHLDIGRVLYEIYHDATQNKGTELDHKIDPDNSGETENTTSESEDPSRLLLVAVRHMNEGIEYMTDEDELVQLARSNLLAGQYCIARTAFQGALEFFQVGYGILCDHDEHGLNNKKSTDGDGFFESIKNPRCQRWKDPKYYDLVLEMHTKLGYVLFCCSYHDEAKIVMKQVLKHAMSLEDKLSAYYTMIESLATQGKFKAAENVSLKVLDQLGMRIPRRFQKIHLLRYYFGTLQRLSRIKSAEELLEAFFNQPSGVNEFSTSNLIEILRFCGILLDNSGYSGNVDTQYLALFLCIKLMLDHGVEETSVMGVVSIGFLHGLHGNMKNAYLYGKSGVEKAKAIVKHGGTYFDLDGVIITYLYAVLIPLGEPYHNCLNPLLSGYKLALDRGQLDMLVFPILCYSAAYFQCGLRLGPLKKDLLRFTEMLLDYGQTENLLLIRSTVELVIKLMGDPEDESILSDESLYSMRDGYKLTEPDKHNSYALQCYYRHQMILAYYMEDITLAHNVMAKLKSPKREGPMLWLPQRHFFEALVLFGKYKMTGLWWHRMRGHRFYRKVQNFHDQGNVNCHHMVLILHAEFLSLCEKKDDDTSAVQAAYDKAIAVAGKRGFLHDQALGNELAGKYFMKREDVSWAATYLTRSYELFSQWGAITKVRQMEQKYGDILGSTIANESTRAAKVGGSGYKARSRLDEMTPITSSSRASIVNMSFKDSMSGGSSRHSSRGSGVMPQQNRMSSHSPSISESATK